MNPEFIPRSFNYKIKHYVLCLYSQTTRDTEMEEVTRNQEENRKQVETREQEDVQSFPARIPYIYTYHFYTQIYIIIISGTYTSYLSFPHTNIYYHFWHVYRIYLSFLHTYIYRPIYHDNISAPDITKTMLDVAHSV